MPPITRTAPTSGESAAVGGTRLFRAIRGGVRAPTAITKKLPCRALSDNQRAVYDFCKCGEAVADSFSNRVMAGVCGARDNDATALHRLLH
jgi:hypothetical protein